MKQIRLKNKILTISECIEDECPLRQKEYCEGEFSNYVCAETGRDLYFSEYDKFPDDCPLEDKEE